MRTGAKGSTVKKAAIALIVSVLALCMLTVAGCGNGTWTNTGGAVSKFGAGPLVYDSTHNVLYAGCEQQVDVTGETARGVWKYDGTNWTNTGGAVSSFEIDSLAYDPTHNLLYAGCIDATRSSTGTYIYKGVWKYDGTTWTNTGGAVSIFIIPCLAYDPIHNLLYAGTDGVDVWKYDGKNWTDTGGPSGAQTSSLAYDPTHNLLYAGAGNRVFKYDGTSWTDTGGAVEDTSGDGLLYDATHNLLYAGTYGPGVWKYDGTSWASTGGGVSSYKIDSLAYDPGHNLLYASCEVMPSVMASSSKSKGVWKYNGSTWTNTGGPVSNYLVSLAYDSAHNLLYAGCIELSKSGTVTGEGVWKYK